jgi:arylsulfatase A-like enzyme
MIGRKAGLTILVALAIGCGKLPHPAPTRGGDHHLPGDAIAYRFIDHAGDAELAGAEIASAWRALRYPAKLVSPRSGLSGDKALRLVELALADADVADYGTTRARAPGRPPAPRLDPVWNRSRAVYESKTALFAPASSRYSFGVPQLTQARFRASVATTPGAETMEFIVEIDGHELLRRQVAPAESGRWITVETPAPSGTRVTLTTRAVGPSSVGGFWGDPVLVVSDAGAPGLNVLFVIIDTLRADALAVMPRLRALEGAHFEQAITAASWTRPSVIAMLGGDLPSVLGQAAEDMIPTDADRRRFYALGAPLLPQLLASTGYLTSAIGNNFFLLGYPQIGLSLGFDEVADIRHPVLDTPAITAAAKRFLAAHARESWLLHLHYDAPHWPYTPPPEYLRRVQIPPGFPHDPMAREYLAEAAYADDYLAQVIDELDRLGLRQRTIVVVVGDHGEVFDHAHAHTVEALRLPTLHHHGWSAYDEIAHVPLLISLPGTIPDTHVGTQVSLVDVLPTLLDLMGRPRATASASAGRSLAPAWRGGTLADRPAFVEGQNVRALRDDGWAYLRRTDGRLTLPVGPRRVDEELYDLRRDPLQHENRVGDAPDMLARMRAAFARLAPVVPDVPQPVLHLQVADDARAHVVEGTLRAAGSLTVRGIAGGEIVGVDARSVRLRLPERGRVDLLVEPPNARVELALRRDGIPLRTGQLLLGRFALPLLDEMDRTVIDDERWSWLDSERPPLFGERGEVLLWRDPSRAPQTEAAAPETHDEVAGMMRRWGYAQPER